MTAPGPAPAPGQDPAPESGTAPDPRRQEEIGQNHSADARETLFSAGPGAGSTGAAAGAEDRLAEAVEVMIRIRRHGQWESSQTHASLLPYLLEESWELVDAVSDGDRDELVSELGDLLLQVLFHAAIGAERDDDPFDIQDVAGALLDKLRRRAPYWFTDEPAHGLDPAEQDRLWQEAKAAERAGGPPRGVVEGIAWDMPALALGQKVWARARAAGVPDDLVPAGMRVVHVDPSDSAEVTYRQAVRRFAHDLREAESSLPGPVSEATPADWHAAWPS